MKGFVKLSQSQVGISKIDIGIAYPEMDTRLRLTHTLVQELSSLPVEGEGLLIVLKAIVTASNVIVEKR